MNNALDNSSMIRHHKTTIVIIILLCVCLILCGCEKPQGKKEPVYIAMPPEPKIGQDFIVDLGSSITLEMVWVPGGTFLMGAPESDQAGRPIERPQTQVQLNGFWMAKYEITQEQYQQITGVNPSNIKGKKNPVETISWRDAMAYCKDLSAGAIMEFTLPTGGQWEYACRAGTQTRFFSGDLVESLGEYAWHRDNSKGTTHPVGEKRPNAFGFFDMHGNVFEWCLSYYKPYPYIDTDGRNDSSIRASRYLYRGGSYMDGPLASRSALRARDGPKYDLIFTGFRVVANPGKQENK